MVTIFESRSWLRCARESKQREIGFNTHHFERTRSNVAIIRPTYEGLVMTFPKRAKKLWQGLSERLYFAFSGIV